MTAGPQKGWLLIDGGGVPKNVTQRFVTLAGGPDANVVFIPTASSDDQIEKAGFFRGHGKGLLRRWGMNPDHVTMLHTRVKEQANSEHFVSALRNASGVVIWGGRQWRLADAYLDTAVEWAIKALVDRGGVVFGTSAGATIQGSFLVRGAPGTPDNPDGDNTMMISPGHERGFALLTNSAIDQHMNTRRREDDLLQVIRKRPELLGIGIDEGAWIEVHADSFTVFGGRVSIHDPVRNDSYYFLSPGDRLDLRSVHVKALVD